MSSLFFVVRFRRHHRRKVCQHLGGLFGMVCHPSKSEKLFQLPCLDAKKWGVPILAVPILWPRFPNRWKVWQSSNRVQNSSHFRELISSPSMCKPNWTNLPLIQLMAKIPWWSSIVADASSRIHQSAPIGNYFIYFFSFLAHICCSASAIKDIEPCACGKFVHAIWEETVANGPMSMEEVLRLCVEICPSTFEKRAFGQPIPSMMYRQTSRLIKYCNEHDLLPSGDRAINSWMLRIMQCVVTSSER